MSEPNPTDQLTGLRRFLARLEANELKLVRPDGTDETANEIVIVKREIARLEEVLAELSARTK